MEKQRSPATINRDLSCLRQILGIAVREELIQKSPFFGGRVEFLHEKGRERTLSFEEERKYLKAAAPVLRDVGIIMAEMGLRPGEIFQLRREHVRIEASAPYVHVSEGKIRPSRAGCSDHFAGTACSQSAGFEGKGRVSFSTKGRERVRLVKAND